MHTLDGNSLMIVKVDIVNNNCSLEILLLWSALEFLHKDLQLFQCVLLRVFHFSEQKEM